MSTIPHLPHPSFVQSVRDSAVAICQSYNISINRLAINRLLESSIFTDTFKILSKVHGLAFPLKFSSFITELNLLSTLSLLNFASGYRVPLHIQTGRGSWDNIRALVFALFISSSPEYDYLSAQGMKSITEQQIAEFMHVNVHVERPHESIPGVVIGELGGPVYQLIQLIANTLHETGGLLSQMGYPDLGSFVLQALKKGRPSSGSACPNVDVVLDEILSALPSFRDMHNVKGQPVYIFKKALFLMHAIHVRFDKNENVPVPDTSVLPVFSDNVIPSFLVALGIIDLSDTPEDFPPFFGTPDDAVDSILGKDHVEDTVIVAELPEQYPEGPTVTEDQAYILRAAAIFACDVIIEVAKLSENKMVKDMTLIEFNIWLWAIAEDKRNFRCLPRFVLRDTVMF